MESGFLYEETRVFYVGKNKTENAKVVDIFADDMIYYTIDQCSLWIRFMTEESRCDTFQLLKQQKDGMCRNVALETTVHMDV